MWVDELQEVAVRWRMLSSVESTGILGDTAGCLRRACCRQEVLVLPRHRFHGLQIIEAFKSLPSTWHKPN